MGQYFKAVILAPQSKELKIVASFSAWDYDSFSKQMEHAWQGNTFVETVESLFTKGSKFYKHRLVWAGDYAENEPNMDYNLYNLTDGRERKGESQKLGREFRYIVNHSKKHYVDKTQIPSNSDGWQIHPLPLLTAEGNEGAGGEYHDCYPDHYLLGTWARDIISVEDSIPEGYTQLKPQFIEKR